jgi:hypothetical protein
MVPGDKVICVDAKIDPDKTAEVARDFEIWVTKDEEYTVRELLDNDGIVTGVLLEEVHNFPKWFKIINRWQEPAFASWRFRKLERASRANHENIEESLQLVEEAGVEMPWKIGQ